MFYLSTIIDIFVRKITLIFCFTAICLCAKTIDAVEFTENPKHHSGNNDWNCVETALKDVNLQYKITPHSELGLVYKVIPRYGVSFSFFTQWSRY